jgi:hypothetical protein
MRVIRPVAATLGKLDDAAPAHIRVAVGLRDLFAVLGDVVEDEAFAQ